MSNILIYLMLEFITLCGTSRIIRKYDIDAILNVANQGYKIDKKYMEQYEKTKKKDKKKNRLSNILIDISLFIPGINMISAIVRGIKYKNNILNDPTIKASIIPMSDEELEEYANIKNKECKALYATFDLFKYNDDEKIIGFTCNIPIGFDFGLTSVRYASLPYYAYTLDDVKKLNDITNYSYRLGRAGSRNVAIIGIPNKDYKIKRITFEDDREEYIFDEMNEQEAKDKTFVVYPFTLDNEDKMDVTINEILKSRKNNKRESNCYENYIPIEYSLNIDNNKPKVLSLNPSINSKKS